MTQKILPAVDAVDLHRFFLDVEREIQKPHQFYLGMVIFRLEGAALYKEKERYHVPDAEWQRLNRDPNPLAPPERRYLRKPLCQTYQQLDGWKKLKETCTRLKYGANLNLVGEPLYRMPTEVLVANRRSDAMLWRLRKYMANEDIEELNTVTIPVAGLQKTFVKEVEAASALAPLPFLHRQRRPDTVNLQTTQEWQRQAQAGR